VYLALPPRAFANTYGISGTIIHDQMLPLIQQVAAAKEVPVIDVDTPTAPHPELFPDGVHPNDTGYALVAQVMYDGLRSAAVTGGDAGQVGQGGASGGGGGTGGAGGGPAGGDAGAGASSGGGCSCRLPAGERGERSGGGLFLVGVALCSLRARARRDRRRTPEAGSTTPS
jgi:hypothetical protein